MAAKFSMADPAGLFGAEAHAEAADRLQGAAEELRAKHARADAVSARAEQQQAAVDKEQARRQRQALEAQAAAEPDPNVVRAAPEQDAEASDSDDDELLDEDPELERLRAARLKQLRAEHEEQLALRARGHGEYREIEQDAFLPEVTAAPLAAVHFYHRDFERCKILDMHLARLAKRHVECKFLKLDAEKAPFFVDKLAVRVLPTVVCFKDGVAFPDRVLGFEGLAAAADADDENEPFGSRAQLRAKDSDDFPTSALACRLAAIGAIREQDEPSD